MENMALCEPRLEFSAWAILMGHSPQQAIERSRHQQQTQLHKRRKE